MAEMFGSSFRPDGTADCDADVGRPFVGTGTAFDSPPKAEALGYSRASLRESAISAHEMLLRSSVPLALLFGS